MIKEEMRMRENRTYEKPKMKFVSTRNEEAVADTCWGHHNKGTTLYYDTEGLGYVSFKIASGSCALNLTDVKYHANHNSNGNCSEECTELSKTDPKTNEVYTTLEKALKDAGGNAGQNFNGSSAYISESPKPEWS